MKIMPKGTYLRNAKINPLSPNTTTDFTRRIPSLPRKQLIRDSRIIEGIIKAYDVQGDVEKTKDLFFKNARLLSNPRYWEVMRTVWIAVGSTDNACEFIPFMKSDRPCKGWFMTPEDAKDIDSMSFPITVYRAYDSDDDKGISWSTDRAFVEEYARRKGRRVKEMKVERERIFAYITRRFESEIIILPDEGEIKGSDV